MEDIIQKFGIDGKLIVIQIINFTVLVGLLSYFLYKPLLKVLADREEKIAAGIADAEEAGKARATTHASEKASEITMSAEEKANAILRQAEARGEDIKSQAHKDSEAEIAKLAVLAAEKVLAQKTS